MALNLRIQYTDLSNTVIRKIFEATWRKQIHSFQRNLSLKKNLFIKYYFSEEISVKINNIVFFSVFQVLNHINEDKRKTEGQTKIFEIFSDIENCPPEIVSSHRM